ncbi:MAG: mechanosensitive ion channel family protein [Chloroflexota bacterium]|nr:mechanosensitive ion channel family protein [Chloroflexota bacterium]
MDRLESPLISSLLIVALTALGLAVAQFLGKRFLRTVHSMEHLREARRQQLLTLVQVLRWVVAVLVVGSALMMLLSTFGVDITPLLANAGVAGLAVSLAAQTLIKDLIGGFLILVENQYAVGDSIQVGDVSGTVERITLRGTYIRDINGFLHFVPNGEVRIVSNQTKEWSRALVDIGVAYEEDMNRVIDTLERVAEAFAQDPTFEPQLLEPPQVVGPVSLGDWAITVRVMVKTQPGKQWGVARELQKRILATCEREDITLPYPRQEVWVRDFGHGDAKLSGG